MVKAKRVVQAVRPYLVGGLVGLGQVFLSQVVMAADASTAFLKLENAICAIANAMKGPFGLAVVVVMFAIGAVSLMIGGRRAIPTMITAGVGGVILSSASTFAKIFISADGSTCA